MVRNLMVHRPNSTYAQAMTILSNPTYVALISS